MSNTQATHRAGSAPSLTVPPKGAPKKGYPQLQKNLWIALCDSKVDLRIGGMPCNGKLHYCCLAISPQGDYSIVAQGSDLSKFLPWSNPLPVIAACDDVPFTLITETLDDEEGDGWIARNEDRIIPAPLESSQIQNEWQIIDTTIFSATVLSTALLQWVNEFKQQYPRVIPSQLRFPLWDLAHVYSKHVTSNFILWKITHKGSSFALVKQVHVVKICSYWVTVTDIEKQDAHFAEIGALLSSLKGEDACNSVILFSPEKTHLNLAESAISGFSIVPPPEIKGVSIEYHEAFAYAQGNPSNLDFAEYADSAIAETIHASRKRVVSIGKKVLYAILIVGIVSGLCAGGITWFTKNKSSVNAEALSEAKSLAASQKHLEKLMQQASGTLAQMRQESVCANLLTDLQTILPVGVYAQEIVISEQDSTHWMLEISAIARESKLLPEMLSRLSAAQGIQNSRILYSEHVRLPSAPQAVRYKISAVWGTK